MSYRISLLRALCLAVPASITLATYEQAAIQKIIVDLAAGLVSGSKLGSFRFFLFHDVPLFIKADQ